MKPKMFIASSVEHLDLAYAAQEALEHDVEPTVWTQGVFTLSKTAMASLIDVLDESDFGTFILAPDDITAISDKTKQTVRDKLIFELGLFIGRLGSDRCFLVVPRGVEDLHLPTDLLGLTPATYEPDRQDGNIVAALGPACNRIRKAVQKLRPLAPQVAPPLPEQIKTDAPCSDENDCISLIQSWMGRRSSGQNLQAIRYAALDHDLNLVPGSAQLYIEKAASRWNYVVDRKGKDTIMFKQLR